MQKAMNWVTLSLAETNVLNFSLRPLSETLVRLQSLRPVLNYVSDQLSYLSGKRRKTCKFQGTLLTN